MEFDIISPGTTDDLLKFISENQGSNYRFGAGYTDLIPELRKEPDSDLVVVNLATLKDDMFTSVGECDKGIRIGALVTVHEICNNSDIEKQYPVLHNAASSLASEQVRRTATLGGNLCTASPAGDISCALVALKAECEILSADGTIKVVPAEGFFVDVKKTYLGKDEILCSVIIPFNEEGKKIFSDFIKVGTRRSMEIAVVSLAYHIQYEGSGEISHAGIAIGSVAPVIKFTHSACDYLKGKNITVVNPGEAEEFAEKVLEYASPISDIRASAWYRKEVLFNISKDTILSSPHIQFR